MLVSLDMQFGVTRLGSFVSLLVAIISTVIITLMWTSYEEGVNVIKDLKF